MTISRQTRNDAPFLEEFIRVDQLARTAFATVLKDTVNISCEGVTLTVNNPRCHKSNHNVSVLPRQ